jgi:hypothetical protein
MLRIVLITLVSAMLAASVVGLVIMGPSLIGPTILFGVVLVGLLFENFRYRKLSGRAPGGAFSATGERFIDPESGKLIEVHSDPATGARRYVAIADADDTP